MGKIIRLGVKRFEFVVHAGADEFTQGRAADTAPLGLGLDGFGKGLGGELGIGAQGAKLLDVARGQGANQLLLHGLELVGGEVDTDRFSHWMASRDLARRRTRGPGTV